VTKKPPNTGEEVTTDFSTNHKYNISMNFYCQKIQIGSLDEFSYKYLYNYDLFIIKSKSIYDYFKSKEKHILSDNYSYKKIYTIPHELFNLFTIDKI